MSLATWKAEFYPVTAIEAGRGTWEQSLEHSIKKWEGLLPENLERHGAHLSYYMSVLDSEAGVPLDIDSSSCALCQKAMEQHYEDGYPELRLGFCQYCPLAVFLKDKCDNDGMPYHTFLACNNPQPMIDALKGALVCLK